MRGPRSNSSRGAPIGNGSPSSSAPSISRSSGTAISPIPRMRRSGVDGLMLGRATLGNPWLASALRALLEGREPEPYPSVGERLRFALVHYATMVEEWGEARAVPQMRKHLGYYLKGFPGAAELRERVMTTTTAAETCALIEGAIAELEREPIAA